MKPRTERIAGRSTHTTDSSPANQRLEFCAGTWSGSESRTDHGIHTITVQRHSAPASSAIEEESKTWRRKGVRRKRPLAGGLNGWRH